MATLEQINATSKMKFSLDGLTTDDTLKEKNKELENQSIGTIQTKKQGETKKRITRKDDQSLGFMGKIISNVTYM